jgi:hypothetical protein
MYYTNTREFMEVEIDTYEYGLLKIQLNVNWVYSTSTEHPDYFDFSYLITGAKDENNTTIILRIEDKQNYHAAINAEVLKKLSN